MIDLFPNFTQNPRIEIALPDRVRFGVFELDLKAGELHKHGRVVLLQEQPFQILLMLVEHRGELATREEIRRKLWPNDTVVEFDQAINTAIKKLRQALGDSAQKPKYIETVGRRGYRLLMLVEWIGTIPAGVEDTSGQDGAPPEFKSQPGVMTGKRVSHYRVLEILGGGGMGVVYKAEDIKLGRPVALKFLPEELTNNPAAMERFEREARAASALNHPNICTIHEVDEHASQPFIVMELLEGQALRELISSATSERGDHAEARALQLETLLDFAVQTAEGLNAAHKKGIIHRDIKPANIFVTSNAQAKILDFGLAKLQESKAEDSSSSVGLDVQSKGTSDLNLTRTGVTMGTAAYMSPEQVRGEKLDARTDLFSFGLVLYEMATGQRAFNGATASIVHAAILDQTPTAARELNPKIPARLQAILSKALEKDRKLRYQSAAEIAADLKRLKQHIETKKSTRWWKITPAAIVLAGIGVAAWFATRPTIQAGLPQVKQQQLTINSPENAVTSGAISPDGRNLIYTDAKGFHLRSIDSGEMRDLFQPGALNDKDIEWQIVSWFRDGMRFLANAHRRSGAADLFSSQGTSIWIFSLLSEAPRELRDNAYACSASPDGSLIAFNTNKGRRGDREIWVMGPNGENARKLYGIDEDGLLNCGVWSPDGKHMLYVQEDGSGARFLSRDLTGGPTTVILESALQIPDVSWLSDGRLIYSKWEPGVIGNGICNFWEIRLDGRTGKPLGKSRQLTSWSGFCMSDESATADNKKLAFLKWTRHFTTYLADLDPSGKRVANSRRFTLSETMDEPLDWTPDGKTLILYSNRTGRSGIYRQSLGEDTPQLLVVSDVVNEARVTPDGKWVLYVPAARREEPEPKALMRVPVAGGKPQLLTKVHSNARILCARPPSELCAITQPDVNHKKLIVSAFDAVNGIGPELTRFALDANEDGWFVDLSPDGTRIAALKSPAGPVSILSLDGKATNEIRVKRWTNLHSVHWGSNGKGLFVGAGFGPGTLLYVDLAGNANVLWEHASPFLSRASPDGRHLAIADHTMDRNFWMIENF